MRFWFIGFLFAANLADALLTDYGLRLGVINEANPLMNWLYTYSVAAFFIVKLALPGILLLIMLRYVRSMVITRLMVVACAFYLIILSMHGVWLAHHFSAV